MDYCENKSFSTLKEDTCAAESEEGDSQQNLPQKEEFTVEEENTKNVQLKMSSLENEAKQDSRIQSDSNEASLPESHLEIPSWYIQSFFENDNASVAGPFTLLQLKHYYKLGYIDGLSLVWRDGMRDWLPLSSCAEIKSYLLVYEDDEEEDAQKEEESQELLEEKKKTLLAGVSPTHTYVTPEGVTYIFDITDGIWKTYDEFCVSAGMTQAQQSTSKPLIEKEENEQMLAKKEKMEKRKKYRERRKQRKAAGQWLSVNKNPNVYVSGLPSDVTEEELEKLFRKAGVLKIDPDTMKSKIRLYKTESGNIKGDCLISFVHEVSVSMAIRYLNEYMIRPNCSISVQQAEFKEPQKSKENQANFVVNQKERHKKLFAAKLEQKRLLDWGEDVDDGSGRRIVILKPMFSREEAETYEEGDAFYEELRQEVFDELSTYALIEKVTPIVRHPQGIVCVRFKRSEEAEATIAQFKGRYFAGRQVEAYFFDKKTDLKAQCIPSKKKLQSINCHEDSRFENETSRGIVDAQESNEVENCCHKRKNNVFQDELRKRREEENEVEVIAKKKAKIDMLESKSLEILNSNEDNQNEYAKWLEEQSSDEEFEIKTEE